MSTPTYHCTRCNESIWWHGLTRPAAKKQKAYCVAVWPSGRGGVTYPMPEPHTSGALRNVTYTENGRQTIADRSVVSPTFSAADVMAVHKVMGEYLPTESTLPAESKVRLPAVTVTADRATVQRFSRKYYRLAFLLFRAGQ